MTKRNTPATDVDGDGLRNGQERNVTHTRPYKADTETNTNEDKLSVPMGEADADDDGIEDGDEDKDHHATDNEDDQQGHFRRVGARLLLWREGGG